MNSVPSGNREAVRRVRPHSGRGSGSRQSRYVFERCTHERAHDRPDRRPSQQALAALRHSRDHLAAVVGSLTGDEVERPSYHSWSIAQVLSHLGSGAEIFRLRLAAGFPGGSSPGDDEIQPIWDRWNAMPPQQQVHDALAADDELVTAFTDAAAQDDGSWRLDLFGSEQDLAGLVQMRLGEHALHTWDVAVALDPTVVLPDDAVALVVDRLAALAAWTGRPQPGLQVRVETTGAERVFLLAESGERAELTTTDRPPRLPTCPRCGCRRRPSSGWSTDGWTPTTRPTGSRPTVSTWTTCGRSSPAPDRAAPQAGAGSTQNSLPDGSA